MYKKFSLRLEAKATSVITNVINRTTSNHFQLFQNKARHSIDIGTRVDCTAPEESMSHPNQPLHPLFVILAMFPDVPPPHDWNGYPADVLSTYPACRAPDRDCVVSNHRSRGTQAGSGNRALRCGPRHGWAHRIWICCRASHWRARGSLTEVVGRCREVVA